MQAVRILELPPLKAACFGPLTTPERFEAFDAWFSAYHARLKGEFYPRDFMWYNERLGANEWFDALPEGADLADIGGHAGIERPCGLYAVASCQDADRDQAADWLETHAFLRQWAASSARFKPYENGPCRPERHPLFHIVSPGRLQAEGVSIEDLYDPIEAREGSLPVFQGGIL